MNAFGCVQLMNTTANCVPPVPNSFLGIIEDDTWKSLRVGSVADIRLTDRLTLTGEVAYLPYVSFDSVDHHTRGPFGERIFPASGHGTGVQLEGMLNYLVTQNISVGIGARYWAMWTTEGSRFCINCTGAGVVAQPTSYRAAVENAGLFVQTSYKFGAN
jgi:hypothetical protein